MKKKTINLKVVIDFPSVKFYFAGGTLLKSLKAVSHPFKLGCTHCALFNSSLCSDVDCTDVIYVPVLNEPIL